MNQEVLNVEIRIYRRKKCGEGKEEGRKVDEKRGREEGEVFPTGNLNLSSNPRRVFSSLLYL